MFTVRFTEICDVILLGRSEAFNIYNYLFLFMHLIKNNFDLCLNI